MEIAPIILFVYNRLDHTMKTVEALRINYLAKESDLYIYSDGYKNENDYAQVINLREYLPSIKGFRSIKIIEAKQNFGLSQSIINGVSETIKIRKKAIILEDDLVTSPFFLKFMNSALELYKDKKDVISIHGYVYNTDFDLPETFFIRGADCWGWATWEDRWELFEENGSLLLKWLKSDNLVNEFDFNGNYPYTKMLKNQIKGKNNSWAIRWHATAFLNSKLTLYPGKSLVINIGNDNSGTHSAASGIFDTELSKKEIQEFQTEISEDLNARKSFEIYFKKNFKKSVLKKIITRFLR